MVAIISTSEGRGKRVRLGAPAAGWMMRIVLRDDVGTPRWRFSCAQ